MAQLDSEKIPTCWKEIFVQNSSNLWNEIVINTGGVASTLQDIKSAEHAGGYAYRDQGHRFIYWRTYEDVVELIEESLTTRLSGNQVRYRLSGGLILEGLSVHEVGQSSVDVLVPTLTSLHRLSFPHPSKQGGGQPSEESIFSGANALEAADPKTYHVLNNTPSSIVGACSCLSASNEAVFGLGLANSSVLLVSLEPLSGSATTLCLQPDSIVPRFFSGITDVFLNTGSKEETAGLSLVLHSIEKELYLFCLYKEGLLKVWSCDRAVLIQTHPLSQLSNRQPIGGGVKLVKCVKENGALVLCAYLPASLVIALQPTYTAGLFNFVSVFQAAPPNGVELVDMCMSSEGEVWCGWQRGEERGIVTCAMRKGTGWGGVGRVSGPGGKLSLPPPLPSHLSLDPAQLYIDAIFTNGYFTSTDVAKALSVYRSFSVVDPSIDIRQQMSALIEAEIYNESPASILDDDDYLELANRFWSRLYSCCSQQLVSGMSPLGLLYLESCSSLVMIKSAGFSLVRPLTRLETLLYHTDPNDGEMGRLVSALCREETAEGRARLGLWLHLGEGLSEHIQPAVELLPPQYVNTVEGVLSDSKMEEALQQLIEELSLPLNYSPPPGVDVGDGMRSETGIGAIVSCFRDFAALRLCVCQELVLVMGVERNTRLVQEYGTRLASLCASYNLLCWTCSTLLSLDLSLLHHFASQHPHLISYNSIHHSVLALAANLWAENENKELVRHLLSIKQYPHIITLARILPQHPYKWETGEALLGLGEGEKAYSVLVSETEGEVSSHLRVIALFQQYSRPDLVIRLANRLISSLTPTQHQMETLESTVFLCELEVGHYEKAYAWIDREGGRSADCIHRLIVEMLAANRVDELLSFSSPPLLDHLERILQSRARTSPISQAHLYYHLLYALHIKHDNFKKGGSVMFEEGLRSDDVETQWRCYGAALNCLSLVQPSEAWILRPTGATLPHQDSIEVLTVEDMRREFELAGARYNLAECPIDASASEVIELCVRSGHFKTGLRLAELTGQSMEGPIRGFAQACCLSQPLSLNWIQNNDIYEEAVSVSNWREVGWRVVRRLVYRYEAPELTKLHRAVADTLLHLGHFLPTWLTNSYKERNGGELIRVYMSHGALEEARALAVEYLEAGLGRTCSTFSLHNPLLASAPPLALPIHTIDLLRRELAHHNMEEELDSALGEYLKTAQRITNDILLSA